MAIKHQIGSDALLTTENRVDPSLVMACFSDEASLVLGISVEPSDAITGLLAERGSLVNALWDRIVSEIRHIHGCRVMWSVLFFMAPANQAQENMKKIDALIASMGHNKIDIIAVYGISGESTSQHLEFFDKIMGELSSRRNFGENGTLFWRSINGMRVSLPPVP
jgi:hypothetical protein